MWKHLLELVVRAWRLAEDTAENKTAIKELQLQVEKLTDKVHLLAFELRRQVEREAHEREKLALRLENELLRFERGLPEARAKRLPERGRSQSD
jgi:hypothetical protein